jgi:WD40 repeat protein
MDWREPFAAALASRDARECAPYERLVPAYEALFHAHASAARECESLRAQLEEARSSQQLQTSLSLSLSPSPSSSSSFPSADVQRLQSKLLELQDQMTSFYRKEAEAARERLGLSESNQRLTAAASRLTAESAAARVELEAMREELAQTKGALALRDGQLTVTSEELVRTRELLTGKSGEADRVTAQWEGVTSRIATEKERAAAEINALNASLAVLKREKAGLGAMVDDLTEKLRRTEAALDAAQTPLLATPPVGGMGSSSPSPQQQPQQQPPSPSPSQFPNASPSAGNSGPSSAPPSVALPQRAEALAGRASALFGSVSTLIGQAATKAGIQGPQAAAASAASAAAASVSTLTAASLAGSVTGLVNDYVFATLPLPARPAHTIQAHKGDICAVKFATNCTHVAAASGDGTISVWDVVTGRNAALLLTNVQNNAVLCLDVHGPAVIGGCTDRSVRVWDLATQRVIRSLTGHNGKVQAVVYVPPAGGLGSSLDLAASVATSSSSSSSTSSTPFSRGLILSAGSDKTVKVWDYKDGRCVRTIDTKSIANGVAVSPDGYTVAVANQDGGVRLFDLRTGAKVVESTTAHSGAVASVCFNRADSGSTLLTAGRDNTLRMLDGRTLEPIPARDPAGGGASVGAFERLRAASDGVATGAGKGVVMRHSGFSLAANWSRAVLAPNGQYAVAGAANGHLYSWNVATGAFEVDIVGTAGSGGSGGGAAARRARSARGGAGSDDLFAGAFAELADEDGGGGGGGGGGGRGHGGHAVVGVDWSSNGQYLASGDTNGTVVVWTPH